jgi:hypothetical protein
MPLYPKNDEIIYWTQIVTDVQDLGTKPSDGVDYPF